MSSIETLSFLGTGLSLAFAIGLVLVIGALAFVSWKRSGYRLSTGLLEGLRLLIAVAVGLTLNQPEWLIEYLPEDRPALVVLWDDSHSMDTRDVIDEERPEVPPRTRRAAVQPWLDEALWEPVSDRLDVVVEPLSAASSRGPEATDLSTALSEVLETQPNLRGVVLLSDGDWNAGEAPSGAATRLRMRQVPVFAVGVGGRTRMPDLDVQAVDAPSFGVVGKALRIPFVIESALPREHEATVSLSTTSGEQVTRTVTIPAQGRLESAMIWTPQETGDHVLTLNVPPHPLESIEDNNTRTVSIAIREEALSVLLVESVPRWEYRYLRNALFRDPGVDVACLLFHPGFSKVGGGPGYLDAFPATQEELAEYDVVILGDVGVGEGQLTVEQCRLLVGLVQNQAAGIVFMPGRRGHQLSLFATELEELYPVVLDHRQPRGWGARLPMQLELTETGRRSLLTKLAGGEEENAAIWKTLPGFHWYAAVLRAKAGSEVLAVHGTESNRSGRLPLIVTRTSGTGKILFMGTDSAWRWREGVEDRYHYRFWGQVARWMAYQRHMAQGEAIRLFYSPDRPQNGDLVSLNANVVSLGGDPLQDGTVVVQAIAPSGKTETIRLVPRNEEWGLFTGSFAPREPGEYTLAASCRETGSSLETKLSVQGIDPEQLGQPARLEVLEEIATITQGEMFESLGADAVLERIAALPEPGPEVRRLRLWCHPAWAGTLILLLGIFWIGRKMVGTI